MADINTLLAPLSSLSPAEHTALLATLGNPASVQLNHDIGDTGCIAGEGEAPVRRAGSTGFAGAKLSMSASKNFRNAGTTLTLKAVNGAGEKTKLKPAYLPLYKDTPRLYKKLDLESNDLSGISQKGMISHYHTSSTTTV